ncbi:MAG: hypothetical protein AAB375_03020 [Patescibacteria group bacterium]
MESSIANIVAFVKRHRDRLWRGFIVALVAWSGYNVGIISARNGVKPAQDATIFQTRAAIVSQTPRPLGQGSTTPKSSRTDDPRVVASKSSKTKKYHHPWCAGATQIKEANRLWFSTALAAQQAGYTLAGNCSE